MGQPLTPHQSEVAQRAIRDESARRTHLVVSLTGAHAFGFPSADSDLDLKCVHIAPSRSYLGLDRPEEAAEMLGVVDGVEVDYTSNEIGAVLRGLLKNNGNYLERILGPHHMVPLTDSGRLLQTLARKTISRAYASHYKGFAKLQAETLDDDRKNGVVTAKRLLYVFRTALTGAYLMDTGEVQTDLRVTSEHYRFQLGELIRQKREGGEKESFGHLLSAFWSDLAYDARRLLDDAEKRSQLPATVPADVVRETNHWLIELRLGAL